jgi:hypothetical protein
VQALPLLLLQLRLGLDLRQQHLRLRHGKPQSSSQAQLGARCQHQQAAAAVDRAHLLLVGWLLLHQLLLAGWPLLLQLLVALLPAGLAPKMRWLLPG